MLVFCLLLKPPTEHMKGNEVEALKEVEVAVNTETSSLQESVQVQLLKGVQVSADVSVLNEVR